ncbi:ABC transporter ATP-binding protein [Nocardioides speluncae]|uniref:ABC transporter ATP-binding protein n=1 Tax=Nocardioides speluncae TaxID=2670337 RepID=UPI000D696E43|nr:ABC transporter ATP-binding protein [Nocardioides speluncae]
MAAVTMTGITKSYGAQRVLTGIDLTVADGELVALLGPSGCGKTTLLRIIAGFAAPDEGTLTVGDDELVGARGSVPAERRRIGYVPQEGALFPHLPVRGNILFGLPRRERTADRLAEMMELAELPAHLAASYPHQLSGGQQHRVALARALAPRPRVILLDEPFAALDAALRESAGREVTRLLRAAGTTAVLVTHDQSEALSLADRVAVLRHGRLAQVADPVGLYTAPADVDIASFVGGASVLPASLQNGSAQCVLGDLRVENPGPTGEGRVLVRPEQVHLRPAAAGAKDAVGVVTEVRYFGHGAQVRVELPGTTPLLVARVAGAELPAVGDKVYVEVQGPVRAYPGEAPA